MGLNIRLVPIRTASLGVLVLCFVLFIHILDAWVRVYSWVS
jgi:hypothetical protein